MSRNPHRRRGRHSKNFWREWREAQHHLWEEYGGGPSGPGGRPPFPAPPPAMLHAWREFFHSHMGEWPERHWAFSGRRFKPWHEGIASFNPFVASMLSKGVGLLPLVVLHLLAERPGYGNEVMDRIAGLTRGQWVPNPGAIYPLMSMLEGQGLVESHWEDPEKRTVRIYRLTPYGEQELVRLKAIIRPKLTEAVEVLQALAEELNGEENERQDE